MGKLHCPGQSQISASLKVLERAGSPILCSSPEALGRIIVFTLPCIVINFSNSFINYFVGGSGFISINPLSTFITVILIGTAT